MALKLKSIVPWGRSYDEYVKMFNLTPADVQKSILGCGDGPAAFNSELTQRGGSIISVDPIYAFCTSQIKTRILETAENIRIQIAASERDYIWGDPFRNPADLIKNRLSSMDQFLGDFEHGKEQGRYAAQELPELSFPSGFFDLALSSHFLFLYGNHLSLEFHMDSIRELLRVSSEVRIFPLVDLENQLSDYLRPIMAGLIADGYSVQMDYVDYEFQRGANQMLRIFKPGKLS